MLLRIIKRVRAIGGRLLFGLLAEAFGFQLSNLRLGLIEFGLQFCVAPGRASMHAFPIAHVATQIAHLLTQLGVLTSQFADFLLQLLDKSCQREKLFVSGNPFHKRSIHNASR